MNKLIIKPEHVRNIEGYCLVGVRDFMRLHNINFRQFIQQGILAQTFIDTGDALAIRLVELTCDYETKKMSAV